MNKKNLCVIFGGMSSEHEISLLSAASIIANLDVEKYNVFPVGITKKGHWFYAPDATPECIGNGSWTELPTNVSATISADRKMRGLILFKNSIEAKRVDCVFPVLHGQYGEDGCMQGLLELSGIPYISPGVASSAVSMDKTLTKLVVDKTGVRQADWVMFHSAEFEHDPNGVVEQLEERFAYPMFVKPSSTGSSVGINKAKNRDGLLFALDEASHYGSKILVEECITGLEIETAVLGNSDPQVSVCGQVLPSREFYSYESKYFDSASRTLIPAQLDDETAEKVRDAAKRIYKALDCRCLSRVDFFVTQGDKPEIIFNEINTLPGFTNISMYPKLFAECGIGYSELLDKLVEFACAE